MTQMSELARTQLKLSLIENAYDSFAESLSYVELAGANPSRWKFAVLNLVHAVELVLKQCLVNEHELLVWQDIDRPGKVTVGLERAIQRLKAARVDMDDADVQAIQTAIRWRNNITHYKVDLIIEEVRENYLLIFEFLDKFHGVHFSGSLSDHIPDEHVQTAMDLADSFKREFITFRGRQMHRRWPRKLLAAQHTTFLVLDGTKYSRRTWGNEGYWREEHMEGYEPLAYCRDCGAAVGEYHGPSCCVEECPREGGQLIGCECDWEPSELWALDADEWKDPEKDEEQLNSASGN